MEAGRRNFCTRLAARTWHEMQSDKEPGDYLRVRGRIWRLRQRTPHEDCAELELESRTGRPPQHRCVLLTPFDRPVPLFPTSAALIVTRRVWMRTLLATLVAARPHQVLHAAATARIALLPYQLEPAIAAMQRGITRLLLADAVGLGKTIQAGLILAEAAARGDMGRALVLTPPGLRDQWAGELRERFGLEPVVADAAWLRSSADELPAWVNPWSVPQVVVASIDFVKRPDVRASVEDIEWDAVVVDEAHQACHDTDRHEVAHALACRARYVLLLTATPHAGDQARFESLCRIGSLVPSEPIAMFRRSRTDAGLPSLRRVRAITVNQTDTQRQLHASLLEYGRRVWNAQAGVGGNNARLAVTVLLKRAQSGVEPLRRSLEVRLARLGQTPERTGRQLFLPLDGETDGADELSVGVLAAPGLADVDDERLVLRNLIAAARLAAPGDCKTRALCRLLRRVQEPSIVFTEYRDSLEALDVALPAEVSRVLLHGGLDRAARREAIARFTSGAARVLLATDAAGEGLNLQERCRVVINLELPWNPMRLEQRIGRVDRIGQQRTVHAINLVGRGTPECTLVARLISRLDAARASVRAIDDVLGWKGEMEAAATMLGVSTAEESMADAFDRDRQAAEHCAEPMCLREEARLQTASIAAARHLWQSLVRASRRAIESEPPADQIAAVLVSAIRSRRLSGPSSRAGLIAIFESRIVDAVGRVIDDTPIPVTVPWPVEPVRRRRDVQLAVRALPPTLLDAVRTRARGAAEHRLTNIRRLFDTAAAPLRSRERERLGPAARWREVQPGLFDRRSERLARAAGGLDLERHHAHAGRMAAIDAARSLALSGDPALVMLLLVTR